MAGIVIGAIVGSVVSDAVGAVVADAVLGTVIESGARRAYASVTSPETSAAKAICCLAVYLTGNLPR